MVIPMLDRDAGVLKIKTDGCHLKSSVVAARNAVSDSLRAAKSSRVPRAPP